MYKALCFSSEYTLIKGSDRRLVELLEGSCIPRSIFLITSSPRNSSWILACCYCFFNYTEMMLCFVSKSKQSEVCDVNRMSIGLWKLSVCYLNAMYNIWEYQTKSNYYITKHQTRIEKLSQFKTKLLPKL